MSSKLLFLGMYLALSLNLSWAGGSSDVGGGGRAVVCFSDANIVTKLKQECKEVMKIDPNGEDCNIVTDNLLGKITSIETFDLYEAKLKRMNEKRDTQIYPVKENESYLDYSKNIAYQISYYSKDIADLILSNAGMLEDNIVFQNVPLKSKNDANELSIMASKNCLLATVAVQYSVNGLSFLHIDERLFNHPKNTDLSRKVLLLHELVYKEALKNGQNDSRNTRVFIGNLIRLNQEWNLSTFLGEAFKLGLIWKEASERNPLFLATQDLYYKLKKLRAEFSRDFNKKNNFERQYYLNVLKNEMTSLGDPILITNVEPSDKSDWLYVLWSDSKYITTGESKRAYINKMSNINEIFLEDLEDLYSFISNDNEKNYPKFEVRYNPEGRYSSLGEPWEKWEGSYLSLNFEGKQLVKLKPEAKDWYVLLNKGLKNGESSKDVLYNNLRKVVHSNQAMLNRSIFKNQKYIEEKLKEALENEWKNGFLNSVSDYYSPAISRRLYEAYQLLIYDLAYDLESTELEATRLTYKTCGGIPYKRCDEYSQIMGASMYVKMKW